MRTTIHNAIKARRAERGEEAEGGFSLIELIIVVVILGILVAVAIPLVGQLQKTATENAAKADAANAATTVAAEFAQGTPITLPTASKADWSLAWKSGAAPTTIDGLCIVASIGGTAVGNGSGPGC